MDRNTIVGIVLIGIIIVIFSIVSTPDDKQLEAIKQKQDSLELVKQNQPNNPDNKGLISNTKTVNVLDTIKSDTAKKTYLYNQYGAFATNVIDSNQFYTIENSLVKVTISKKGGRPYAVRLKKYKTHDSLPLILFNGDSTIFGLKFFSQNKNISTNDLFFTPVNTEKNIILAEKDTAKTFALRLNTSTDQYIEYVYTLRANSYMVDFNINLKNMDKVIAQNTRELELDWQYYVRQQEKEKKSENGLTYLFYKYNQDDEVEQVDIGTDPDKDVKIDNKINWVAYKQQFFSSVLISKSSFAYANIKITNIQDSSKHLKVFNSNVMLAYDNKNEQTLSMTFYFGPNHYQILSDYDMELEEIVDLGPWIVRWVNTLLIIPVFNFLNGFISNFGIIILLLTIFIKIILHPLTYKSYLSMAKMRVLKPQVDEINERIPAEKAMERQQAVMAMYKRAGVNPLGGCLPLLLQMPFLIAMFRFFPSSIELRQEGFLWAHDLSTYDAFITWTGDIPVISFLFGNHISLFNLLMTITTIITIRMSNQASMSTTQVPGMKFMTYLMPVMFLFFLNSFSAALTYYYFLTNVITIIQNEIFKRTIDENKLLAQLNENKKKPVKKSSFQARLEEAARKRGYKTK